MIFTLTLNPVIDRTLTVTDITFNEVLRASKVRLDLGGKGINVSRALKALSMDSMAMGFEGGAAGAFLMKGLDELGITHDFIPVKDETRSSTLVIEPSTGKYIKVNETGPLVGMDEQTALIDRVKAKARTGDTWVFSGNLPPGVPVDFYANLIKIVQGEGAKAFLDTSGEPLKIGCQAKPYLVKPNKREAEELTGKSLDTDAGIYSTTEYLLAQGIKIVAISLGEGGLFLASKDVHIRVKPPKITARSPVGVGDALMAGLIWAMQNKCSLEDAAYWGVAFGTTAVMNEGVAIGTRSEVETLYRQLKYL